MSPCYVFVLNFILILNKDSYWVMVLELGFYFLDSFLNSFFGSPLSYDFPSNMISELDPPISSKGTKFLSRDVMTIDMLCEISTTCISIFVNYCS